MSDSINPAPYALNTPDYNALIARGYQMGQQEQQARALQGVNLDDPDSLNAGMNGLIKGGAIDQAGALQNLAFTRNIRNGFSGYMGALAQAMGGQPAAGASSAAPTSPAAPQQPDPMHQQAADLNNKIADAFDSLASIKDPDERQARADDLAHQFVNAGVPAEAIGQHMGNINDTQHLMDMAAQHRQLAQNATSLQTGGQVQPVQPTANQTPSTFSWARNLLNSPQGLSAISYLKMGGLDMTPLLEGAKTMAAPELAGETTTAQQQAEMPFVGQRAAATAQGTYLGAPTTLTLATGPDAGKKQFFSSGAAAIQAYSQNPTAYGEPSPQMAEALKLQQQNLYKTSTVVIGGREVPVTEAHKVELLGGPRADAVPGMPGPGPASAPRAAGDVRTGGTSGASTAAPLNLDRLGTRTPEEQENINAATKELNDNISQKAMQDIQEKQGLYRDVIGLAAKGVSGPVAKFLGPLAQRLGPILGQGLERYGNNYALLDTTLASTGKAQLTGVSGSTIRNKGEFDFATKSGGTQMTPAESLSLTAGLNLASLNAKEAYNKFLVDYQNSGGPLTKGAIQAAWNATPEGKANLRGDPVFAQMKINGKPGLIPYPGKPGWGIFAPGIYGNTQVVRVMPGTFK